MGYRIRELETQVMRRVGNPPELEGDATLKTVETPPPDRRFEFVRDYNPGTQADGSGSKPSHIIAMQISGAGASAAEIDKIVQTVAKVLNEIGNA